ncbi:zinc-binding dehydrogenase, partial [Pirellulales bacterium]|nr:zinc-binding dehydrogenase [Pirellulales bacterium]
QLFGWRSGGNGLHGCQADAVRVPLADGTLVPLETDVSAEMGLLLGDNLTTGFYCAKLAEVAAGKCSVVVGCGTVGLLCIAAAIKLGADQVLAYDPNRTRAALAASFGARAFSDDDELGEAVLSSTAGRGADSVMELVGLAEAQALAHGLLRPGGILSTIGCHCEPHFAFSPPDAYDKNLTYRTGRCPVRSLLSETKQLFVDDDAILTDLVTHRFSLDQSAVAYGAFAGGVDGCQKAVFEI